MTLGEILRDAAASTGARLTDLPDGGTAFVVGETTVAAVDRDGSVAEFRLDPAVASAATRTPDASSSERGPDWVRFAPTALDPLAVDRAVAWLGSAARRAGGT
jgi:hypothetical protein